MQRAAKLVFMIASAALLGSTVANSQEEATQPAPVRGVSVGGAPLTEDSCEVLATTKGKSAELREVPGMYVLDATEDDPLVLGSTDDVKISGVVCWRSEARLAPNDYLVPHKTGFSLYLKTETGNEAADRTVALEKVSGSFRVRLLSGPKWSPEEEKEMEQAIQLYIKRAAGGA